MRTDGSLEHRVDAELGKFVADARPEGFGIRYLVRVGVQEVDVQVETTAAAVGDGIWESRVCRGLFGCGRVDVRFSIVGFLAANCQSY